MSYRSVITAAIAFAAWLPPVPLSAQVVLSELLAVNDSTVQDEDGDYPDYVEIYNNGPGPADLGGHYLTDDELDPTKWPVPSVELPEGGFLLVFCSDKDRVDPGGELHANFKLTSAGEYLALIAPDGVTPVFEYDPFPPQVADFSYGLRQNGSRLRLVREGDGARALIPSSGALGLSWTDPDFDDSSWRSGSTGVGYDRNSTYRSLIDLDVRSAMEDQNTTAYIRVPFEVDDASSIATFTLRMKYDDGFAAWLNGDRVASANAPPSPSWDSSATTLHDDGAAVEFESFAFRSDALRSGENVLAIQGLNDNLGSSDFLALPELDGASAGELEPDVQEYFPEPTPGGGNLQGYPGISARPQFSVPSGVFTGSLSVELTTPDPNGVIRYTTDGSEPDDSSPTAGDAVSIDSSTTLRARSFEPGFAPSPIVSKGYVRIDPSTARFTSDLPIVVLENFGGGTPPQNGFQPGFMAIFLPGDDGRTRLDSAPVLQTRIGIRVRGSSTAGQPKKQYALEAWDEKNEDKDVSIFGMPEEGDWILYGGNSYDQAMIRNKFIFDLSLDMGVYATRTEFCEILFNQNGGTLSPNDNIGVYTFGEKIERNANRVDVEELTASIDSEPEISGGYMFKIDRLDPGDSGFSAGGQRMGWVDPKEAFVTQAQASWLTNYINRFVSALNSPGYRDPERGYRAYIDRQLWVDHHILNVLPMNVDALRLSTYFYKDRGERLVAGPIWDFDRSMGSTDGRDDDPRSWSGSGGTQFFSYPWWERLFDDPDFWQLWIDRWQTLREGSWSTGSLLARIDSMSLEIQEAAERNHARWGWGSFAEDIRIMKNWITARATWIDSQFLPMPELRPTSRPIDPGFEAQAAGAGTLHYTLDGTDPRRPGGAVSPGASVYEGPIVLDDNARVVIRARSGSRWSGPAAASYWVRVPRLVISELMFHPPEPLTDTGFRADDFEFIEFQNTGSEPLDLEGFELSGAVSFRFGPGEALAPGEFVVIVRDPEAFAARYDTSGVRIAGAYDGNLSNAGEHLLLLGPLGEPVHNFSFGDRWYPEADGQGQSLVVVEPYAPLETWSDVASWAPSSVVLGTPGIEDSGVSGLGGRQFPGDSNQDGRVDLSDGISLLIRLFEGSGALPCEGGLQEGGNLALLDVNADEAVDISDAAHLLGWLFQDGPGPALGTGCVRIEGCPSTPCGL